MLVKDQPMFLMIPSISNERVLHPGKTIEVERVTRVCEFEVPVAPEVGDNVVVFSEVRQKFFQQAAVVSLIRRAEPNPVLAFLLTGDPVSAESRGSYRVSVATGGLCVRIGGEARCPLMDVSPEGFSAVMSNVCAIGSKADVTFCVGRQNVTEPVRVQTVKARHDEHFRIGFLIEDKRGPMRRVLERIHAAVQQQQLRRLSGTA